MSRIKESLKRIKEDITKKLSPITPIGHNIIPTASGKKLFPYGAKDSMRGRQPPNSDLRTPEPNGNSNGNNKDICKRVFKSPDRH